MARIIEKGLIVKKVGMTRISGSDGMIIPVTLLKVEDQKVTKVLTKERDGYTAIQVGFYAKSDKNLTKADKARLTKAGVEDRFARFNEFRMEASHSYQLGSALTAEMFKDVTSVDVTGLTKGRGFQGAVKKWNAKIGRMTHGSRFHRRPGSLGTRTTPGRVFKNKHQPGHLGVDQVTIKNVRVIDVDTVNNVIAIRGSVPGHREGFLEIRPTNKK